MSDEHLILERADGFAVLTLNRPAKRRRRRRRVRRPERRRARFLRRIIRATAGKSPADGIAYEAEVFRREVLKRG